MSQQQKAAERVYYARWVTRKWKCPRSACHHINPAGEPACQATRCNSVHPDVAKARIHTPFVPAPTTSVKPPSPARPKAAGGPAATPAGNQAAQWPLPQQSRAAPYAPREAPPPPVMTVPSPFATQGQQSMVLPSPFAPAPGQQPPQAAGPDAMINEQCPGLRILQPQLGQPQPPQQPATTSVAISAQTAALVTTPLTDEERATIQQQLALTDTAIGALKPIPAMADAVARLETEQSALRAQLHRAKPLSTRMASLQSGIQRRLQSLQELDVVHTEALKAVADARAKAEGIGMEIAHMEKELKEVQAQALIEDAKAAAIPHLPSPTELLQQVLLAQARGEQLPPQWATAAAVSVGIPPVEQITGMPSPLTPPLQPPQQGAAPHGAADIVAAAARLQTMAQPVTTTASGSSTPLSAAPAPATPHQPTGGGGSSPLPAAASLAAPAPAQPAPVQQAQPPQQAAQLPPQQANAATALSYAEAFTHSLQQHMQQLNVLQAQPVAAAAAPNPAAAAAVPAAQAVHIAPPQQLQPPPRPEGIELPPEQHPPPAFGRAAAVDMTCFTRQNSRHQPY